VYVCPAGVVTLTPLARPALAPNGPERDPATLPAWIVAPPGVTRVLDWAVIAELPNGPEFTAVRVRPADAPPIGPTAT
jgi:hypothetical protein